MKYSSLLGHTYEALHEFFLTAKPADAILDRFFRSHKYLGARDRRFIAETVYGVLRHLRLSREIIAQIVGNDYAGLGEEKQLRLALVAYSVVVTSGADRSESDLREFLQDTIPANVIDTVLKGLSEHRAAADKSSVGTGVRFSFPDWMVHRFTEEYGPVESERLCQALNEPAPLTIRVNLLKASRDECHSRLSKEHVNCEPTRYSPLGLQIPKRLNLFQLQSFREGYFEVQDEGSQILPLLIDPTPTAKVLDACAGAGGKSLEFAMLMKNRGEIVAADVHDRRLEELRKRSRRAGAHNIRTKVVDLLEVDETDIEPVFDIVLVDAPCSGVGTIRRNPGMKWTVTEETVREISEKQRRILANSARYVKQGGLLVYATCTLFREENEDVVNGFLDAHPGYELEDPTVRVERVQLHGSTSGRFVKLLPHIHGTDGFFCAFLRQRQVP